jgi:hypothetical protein
MRATCGVSPCSSRADTTGPTDTRGWIVEAARKVRQRGGEAVVLMCSSARSISWSQATTIYGLPLSMRKAKLDRLLARRPDGVFVHPFERGEIGPDLFRAACMMGLEGLVSKRRDRPYRGGPVEGLAQGEEPQSPGGATGDGVHPVAFNTRGRKVRVRFIV